MALRPEERQSAELFQKWLERFDLTATWEPVEHDPPDLSYTITLEDSPSERRGVEVTGLFQYVDWDGEEGNRKGIEVPLDRLCERLTKGPCTSQFHHRLSRLRLWTS